MLPVHLKPVCAQSLPRACRCVVWDEGLLPVAVRQLLTQSAGPGHFFNLFVDVWPIQTFFSQYLCLMTALVRLVKFGEYVCS